MTTRSASRGKWRRTCPRDERAQEEEGQEGEEGEGSEQAEARHDRVLLLPCRRSRGDHPRGLEGRRLEGGRGYEDWRGEVEGLGRQGQGEVRGHGSQGQGAPCEGNGRVQREERRR